MKYGLMIGRFQPFHFGHQHIVNEIMLDGLKPIMAIGSTNDDRDLDKNPLSFEERKDLIYTIYNETSVNVVNIQDFDSWDDWVIKLTLTLAVVVSGNMDDIVLYYHNKEVDRCDFVFNGKEYKNTFYTEVFKNIGFTTKQIEFVDRHDFQIDSNARDIRHDIEGFKHFLDARIYKKLKEKGW